VAQKLESLLKPQSIISLASAVPPSAWAEPEFEGKIAFIKCLEDYCLPGFLQDLFVERSGVSWKVRELDTGHSPFASKPDETAQLILDIAAGLR
jgi:hypothetical protein